MSEARIEIFTSPTCPYCPGAVNAAKELQKEMPGLKIVETSTYSGKGRKRADNFDVRSVPTVFVTSNIYEGRIGFVGSPGKDRLRKMVNIATGMEKWEEKESIISRLSKKLKIKIKI